MYSELLPYNHNLIKLAKQLRKHGTLSEVLVWEQLKSKHLQGYDFDRQKPIKDYIVDFFAMT